MQRDNDKKRGVTEAFEADSDDFSQHPTLPPSSRPSTITSEPQSSASVNAYAGGSSDGAQDKAKIAKACQYFTVLYPIDYMQTCCLIEAEIQEPDRRRFLVSIFRPSLETPERNHGAPKGYHVQTEHDVARNKVWVKLATGLTRSPSQPPDLSVIFPSICTRLYLEMSETDKWLAASAYGERINKDSGELSLEPWEDPDVPVQLPSPGSPAGSSVGDDAAESPTIQQGSDHPSSPTGSASVANDDHRSIESRPDSRETGESPRIIMPAPWGQPDTGDPSLLMRNNGSFDTSTRNSASVNRDEMKT